MQEQPRRVHLGKILVWNASGVEPRACQTLQWIADASGSREPVWKCSGLPTEQQGIKVFGTPLRHADFVFAHLDRVLSDHRTLLERIPAAGRPVRVGTAPSQRSLGQLPSQSRQTGSRRGFCQGARRRVVAVHVRDSQGALRRRTTSQRRCFLVTGRAGSPALPHGRSLR